MFLGSLTVPLSGCGDKYGESVSTTNLSKGTSSATSLGVLAFVNVTGPSKPIYKPRFKTSCKSSTLPD